MIRKKISIWLVFFNAIALLTACEECKDTTLTDMLYPLDPDLVLSDTQVDYRELNTGITCSGGDLTAASRAIPSDQLVTNYKAISGHADYGNYQASAALLRSEAALNALKNAGCLNDLDPTIQLDWAAQTLVIIHVSSTSGCEESTSIKLQEGFNKLAHLLVDVHYTPNDNCGFEFTRTVIIDQGGAVAHFSLSAGCRESSSAED